VRACARAHMYSSLSSSSSYRAAPASAPAPPPAPAHRQSACNVTACTRQLDPRLLPPFLSGPRSKGSCPASCPTRAPGTRCSPWCVVGAWAAWAWVGGPHPDINAAVGCTCPRLPPPAHKQLSSLSHLDSHPNSHPPQLKDRGPFGLFRGYWVSAMAGRSSGMALLPHW